MNSFNFSNKTPKTCTATRVTTALLFTAFSFCYIYFMQCDMLAYLQHTLSHEYTSYNRLLGAIIVTAFAMLVHAVVATIVRLPAKAYALTYLPAALFLAALTDVTADYSLTKLIFYLAVALLTIVVYVILSNSKLSDVSGSERVSELIPNVLTIALLMTGAGLCGNSNDRMHYELKMQRLLNDENYEAAARVGEKSLVSSPLITCLRAYALSRTGNLGEKLFEYPVSPATKSLLPLRDDSVRMIFNPDKIYDHIGGYPHASSTTYQFLHLITSQPELLKRHPQSRDYLLTSLLLDKKLDMFASEIKKLYAMSDDAPLLPKHYREALILYSRSRTNAVVNYKNTITETNYNDFVECQKKYHNPNERANALRRQFGDTYWWYYFYVKTCNRSSYRKAGASCDAGTARKTAAAR